MHTEILEAIKAISATKPSGKVTSTEVADYMGVDRSRVMRPITELAKDELVIRHNNYYSMPESKEKETDCLEADKSQVNASSQKSKNDKADSGWMWRATDTEKPKENTGPSDSLEDLSDIEKKSKALSAIGDLEKKLKHQVADKALKIEVLNRLSALLSSDISTVLDEIAGDLEAI